MSRPPRTVVLATIAFGLLTAFWSVLTPLTEAPDEPAHLGLVYHVAETGQYPGYDELQHVEGLFQLCVDFATTATWCRTDAERAAGQHTRERPAAAAPAKHDRVHWDDPEFRRLKPGRMNQMPQHPPLYYLAMAGAIRIERAVTATAGGLSVDTELAYLRLLNALIVLPLPWLAWSLARRFGAPPPVGAVASLVPLAVPQVTHIGGTLNNDNLFVVLVSALMVLLAGVLRGDRSTPTALLVGLVTGLALLTKGFGVLLPIVVIAAYLVGSTSAAAQESDAAGQTWRHRWRPAAPAAGALAVGFVVSGRWYVGNLLATGHVMPSIENERLSITAGNPGFSPRFGEYAASTSERLVEGFWGAFGWRWVELPTAFSVAASVMCLSAAVIAFRRPPRTEPPITRARLAVLLGPVALLTAFVLVRSAVIYYGTGRLAFQQGRYLFGGLTAAAVVVALGVVRLLGSRAVPAMVVGALALQCFAVAWCLDGWWGADGVPVGSLQSVVAWSGLPDPAAVALLALAPISLALVAHAAWRHPAALDGASTTVALQPAEDAQAANGDTSRRTDDLPTAAPSRVPL